MHWFRLLRIAGLTTLLSNIVAVLVTTRLDLLDLAKQSMQSGHLGWVLLASVGIYLAGMIWNDVADVERDRLIAPQRPLPSGGVSYLGAWIAGSICITLALLCAGQIGWRGFYACSIVLSLALLYDLGAKHVPWLGSLVMAATRAGHAVFALLILGFEHFDLMLLQLAGIIGIDAPITGVAFLYPLYLGLYIFGITLISELEHRRSYRWEILLATLCIAAALLVLLWNALTSFQLRDFLVERRMSQAILLLLAIALYAGWLSWNLGKTLWPLLRLARKALVGPFMIRGLSGIILFDCLLIIAYVPLLSIPVLMLLIPFKVLGRIGRMD